MCEYWLPCITVSMYLAYLAMEECNAYCDGVMHAVTAMVDVLIGELSSS